jgi:hypothetical protein
LGFGRIISERDIDVEVGRDGIMDICGFIRDERILGCCRFATLYFGASKIVPKRYFAFLRTWEHKKLSK